MIPKCTNNNSILIADNNKENVCVSSKQSYEITNPKHMVMECASPFVGKPGNIMSEKLFCSEVFYIDPKLSQFQEVERKILAVGGKVEKFMSKDVTCVISDKKSQRLSSSFNSPGDNVMNCHKFSSMSPLGGSPLLQSPMSRGQALLMKSNQQHANNRVCSDVISTARQLGIPIVEVKDMLKHLNHEIKRTDPNLLQSPIGNKSVKKSYAKVKPLKGNYIKFEHFSLSYRPVYGKLTSFPVVDFQDNCEGSPFDPEPIREIKKEKTKGKNKEKLEKNEPLQNTPKPVKTEKKPKSGYCESCESYFSDLRNHLVSKSHLQFVEAKENFMSLDNYIGGLPSVKSLVVGLKKGVSDTMNDQCHSTPFKSQSAVINSNHIVQTFENDVNVLCDKSYDVNQSNIMKSVPYSIPQCISQYGLTTDSYIANSSYTMHQYHQATSITNTSTNTASMYTQSSTAMNPAIFPSNGQEKNFTSLMSIQPFPFHQTSHSYNNCIINSDLNSVYSMPVSQSLKPHGMNYGAVTNIAPLNHNEIGAVIAVGTVGNGLNPDDIKTKEKSSIGTKLFPDCSYSDIANLALMPDADGSHHNISSFLDQWPHNDNLDSKLNNIISNVVGGSSLKSNGDRLFDKSQQNTDYPLFPIIEQGEKTADFTQNLPVHGNNLGFSQIQNCSNQSIDLLNNIKIKDSTQLFGNYSEISDDISANSASLTKMASNFQQQHKFQQHLPLQSTFISSPISLTKPPKDSSISKTTDISEPPTLSLIGSVSVNNTVYSDPPDITLCIPQEKNTANIVDKQLHNKPAVVPHLAEMEPCSSSESEDSGSSSDTLCSNSSSGSESDSSTATSGLESNIDISVPISFNKAPSAANELLFRACRNSYIQLTPKKRTSKTRSKIGTSELSVKQDDNCQSELCNVFEVFNLERQVETGLDILKQLCEGFASKPMPVHESQKTKETVDDTNKETVQENLNQNHHEEKKNILSENDIMDILNVPGKKKKEKSKKVESKMYDDISSCEPVCETKQKNQDFSFISENDSDWNIKSTCDDIVERLDNGSNSCDSNAKIENKVSSDEQRMVEKFSTDHSKCFIDDYRPQGHMNKVISENELSVEYKAEVFDANDVNSSTLLFEVNKMNSVTSYDMNSVNSDPRNACLAGLEAYTKREVCKYEAKENNKALNLSMSKAVSVVPEKQSHKIDTSLTSTNEFPLDLSVKSVNESVKLDNTLDLVGEDHADHHMNKSLSLETPMKSHYLPFKKRISAANSSINEGNNYVNPYAESTLAGPSAKSFYNPHMYPYEHNINYKSHLQMVKKPEEECSQDSAFVDVCNVGEETSLHLPGGRPQTAAEMLTMQSKLSMNNFENVTGSVLSRVQSFDSSCSLKTVSSGLGSEIPFGQPVVKKKRGRPKKVTEPNPKEPVKKRKYTKKKGKTGIPVAETGIDVDNCGRVTNELITNRQNAPENKTNDSTVCEKAWSDLIYSAPSEPSAVNSKDVPTANKTERKSKNSELWHTEKVGGLKFKFKKVSYPLEPVENNYSVVDMDQKCSTIKDNVDYSVSETMFHNVPELSIKSSHQTIIPENEQEMHTSKESDEMKLKILKKKKKENRKAALQYLL